MKVTLCIGGGHSHHQFGVNLVGFHAIIFTVWTFSGCVLIRTFCSICVYSGIIIYLVFWPELSNRHKIVSLMSMCIYYIIKLYVLLQILLLMIDISSKFAVSDTSGS